MPETSDRVSSIAGFYASFFPDDLEEATANAELRAQLCRDIRSLAASALRQDETRGIRKLARTMKEMLR